MTFDEPVPQYEDRPDQFADQRSATEQEEFKRAQLWRQRWREDVAFLQGALQSEAGQRFIWKILEQSGAFEESYAHHGGVYVPEACWAIRGKKDLGLAFYHLWSGYDRAGMLALVDRFLPGMPKEPPMPAPPKEPF